MPQSWKPMTTNWYNRNDFINNHRYYRHHCYYYYYYCGPLGLIIDQLWPNNNLYVCNDPEILYPWSSKTREVLGNPSSTIPDDFLRPKRNLKGLRKSLGRWGWISQCLPRFGEARIQWHLWFTIQKSTKEYWMVVVLLNVILFHCFCISCIQEHIVLA